MLLVEELEDLVGLSQPNHFAGGGVAIMNGLDLPESLDHGLDLLRRHFYPFDSFHRLRWKMGIFIKQNLGRERNGQQGIIDFMAERSYCLSQNIY